MGLLAALLGCVGGDGVDSPTPVCVYEGEPTGNPLDREGDAVCGGEVYAGACASCHGATGGGTEESGALGVPPLAEHVRSHTDAEIVLLLVAGSGEMPPQDLHVQATADVLAWLRHHFGDYDGQGH